MGRFRFSVRTMMYLIIGVALFLKAFQSLLPKSGRLVRQHLCLSNLRNVGLGVLAYSREFDEFPRGRILPDAEPEDGLSWICSILQQIDMQDIQEQLDADQPWQTQPTLSYTPYMGLIVCPNSLSKPAPSGLTTASYVGIAGLGPDAPTLPAGHPRSGIFGYTRVTRPADIKDGAAQTLLLVETESNLGCWMSGGSATIRPVDPATRPYIGVGRPFGGLHEGGTNVIFADGSARFIRDTVDPKVFEAMATVDGGEHVSLDE